MTGLENGKEFTITVRPMDAGDTQLLYNHFCDLSERSRAKFRPHDFTIETAQKFTGEGLAIRNASASSRLRKKTVKSPPRGTAFWAAGTRIARGSVLRWGTAGRAWASAGA